MTEIFSPPRFTEKCKAVGLLPGYAVDLETGWDLTDNTQVKCLEKILDEEGPYLTTGSPPCDLFSILQGLNPRKNGPREIPSKIERRKRQEMLETSCSIYNKGSRKGRISYMNIRSQQSRGKKSASKKSVGCRV